MNIIQNLMSTGGPIDLHLSRIRGAQAEVKALVARRKITACRSCEPRLAVHPYPGPESIAVAASAAKSNRKPVHLATTVQKHLRMAAQRGHHNILPAIIIQVAECCPTACPRDRRARISSFEAATVIHRQQWRFKIMQRRVDLLDVIQHMPLSDE